MANYVSKISIDDTTAMIRDTNAQTLCAGLRADLTTETNNRIAGDSALQNSVDTEKSARESADNTLQSNINAEKSARESADNTLQSKITVVDRRDPLSGKIILVGDSYMVGVGATSDTGLASMIAKYCNKTIGSTAFNFGEGGTGFVGGTSNSFETVMKNHANEISDKENVTAIIVIGGTNDAIQTFYGDRMWIAAESLFKYCQTTYPNARIFFGDNVVCAPNTLADIMISYEQYFNNQFQQYCTYIGDMGVVVKKLYTIYGNTMAEFIHPNATGYEYLGRIIAGLVKGGKCELEICNARTQGDYAPNGAYDSNGKICTFHTHMPILTDGKAIQSAISSATAISGVYLGKLSHKFIFTNPRGGTIPFVTGEGVGFIGGVNTSGDYVWNPIIIKIIMTDDGYANLYGTAITQNAFLTLTSFTALQWEYKITFNLDWVRLNI